MLALFPQLFVYGFFAIALLRITTALFFIASGVGHWKRLPQTVVMSTLKWMGVIETIAGLFLLVGLWSQLAAIVLFALTIWSRTHSPTNAPFKILICIVLLALLFLGAGPFAFDVPL